MVAHGLRQQRHLAHESKGINEILEDKQTVKLILVQAPIVQLGQFFSMTSAGSFSMFMANS